MGPNSQLDLRDSLTAARAGHNDGGFIAEDAEGADARGSCFCYLLRGLPKAPDASRAAIGQKLPAPAIGAMTPNGAFRVLSVSSAASARIFRHCDRPERQLSAELLQCTSQDDAIGSLTRLDARDFSQSRRNIDCPDEFRVFAWLEPRAPEDQRNVGVIVVR